MSVNGIDNREPGRRGQSPAQLERDAALDRVGRMRRWLIAGAAGLTAAFAALVSVVAPGRTLAARTQGGGATEARTSTPPASSSQMPSVASPSQLGLQGPDQPPQAASAPSQAPSDPSQAAPAPAQAPSDPAQATPAPAPVPAPAVSGGS